jgi:hypothetical protein
MPQLWPEVPDQLSISPVWQVRGVRQLRHAIPLLTRGHWDTLTNKSDQLVETKLLWTRHFNGAIHARETALAAVR